MKKLLLLLLTLSLVLSTVLLASCDSKKPPVVTDDETESTEESKEQTIEDILGFGEQNYNEEFQIFLNNAYEGDFYAAETESDLVSVATYDRNLACEEFFGISIEYTKEPGNWNSGFPDKLYTLVMTGACDYDMVAMGLNTGLIGGHIDIYENILQMDQITPTHAWWVQDLIEQISINNQLYFIAGDAAVSSYQLIGCIFANLSVAENFNLDVDFYELVKSGNWTMAEFLRLFRLVGVDGNDDGKFDSATETFGWANYGIGVRLMWSSCDINLIERQSDDTFAVRSGLDDRIVSFVSALKEAYDDPHHDYLGTTKPAVDAFVTDRVLFVSGFLSLAENFKTEGITSPYAILPMPKYDTQQADYISTNMPAYNVLYFPKNIPSLEMSAQVAEYMGWYGQEKIVPAYYDQTLMLRQNDVEANIEMLNMIRDNLRVTPNESYGTIGREGTDAPMYLTQMTDSNCKDTAFYSVPSSVWKSSYPNFYSQISNYVFQYFK